MFSIWNCKIEVRELFWWEAIHYWWILYIYNFFSIISRHSYVGLGNSGVFKEILLVILGGFCLGNGMFLMSCVTQRIPFSISFAIYGGCFLIEGTLLNYVIEKLKLNLLFFSLGIIFAFIGILLMATAASFSNKIISDRNVSKFSYSISTCVHVQIIHSWQVHPPEQKQTSDQESNNQALATVSNITTTVKILPVAAKASSKSMMCSSTFWWIMVAVIAGN